MNITYKPDSPVDCPSVREDAIRKQNEIRFNAAYERFLLAKPEPENQDDEILAVVSFWGCVLCAVAALIFSWF